MNVEDAKTLIHEHISDFCLSADQFVGVVIKKNSLGRNHCGIVFKDKDKSKLIHLKKHCKLELLDVDDLSADRYLWIESKIHPKRQRMVTGMCRRISERHMEMKIPFGLNYHATRFNEKTGEVVLGSGEYGLTCATFVLAVYDSCGFNLLDLDSWPTRPDDAKWHKDFIRTMEYSDKFGEYGVGNAHIEKMKKSVACARFRPEEVAAGTMFKDNELPVSFDSVLPCSNAIASSLS